MAPLHRITDQTEVLHNPSLRLHQVNVKPTSDSEHIAGYGSGFRLDHQVIEPNLPRGMFSPLFWEEFGLCAGMELLSRKSRSRMAGYSTTFRFVM
jgi:hypothetical protein